MKEILNTVMMAIAIAVILMGCSVLFHQMTEDQIEPVAVTINSVERVELRFSGGLFSASRVESMPYIIAETESGETIIGIIDISTLAEGDKIVIIEDDELKGYKWYRFVDYQ